jgi:hypothetical protein
MSTVLALRLLLYVQLLTGLVRSSPIASAMIAGVAIAVPMAILHFLFGIVIAILAPLAFGPVAGVPDTTLRRVARLAPLAPLLVGLIIRFGGLVGLGWVVVHIILGITTIALVEIAAARQRRALAT